MDRSRSKQRATAVGADAASGGGMVDDTAALVALIERLQRRSRAWLFRGFDTLDATQTRLCGASEAQRELIARALSGVPLADALDPSESALSSEMYSRDLHTTVQRVGGVVKAVVAATEPPPIGDLELQYRRFDLAAEIRRICASFGDLAQERGISFSISAPGEIVVEADQNKLLQVVLNLVFNAFKHTGVGGHIRCDIDSGEHDVRVSVADDGMGISLQHAESIFDAVRLHNRSVCCSTPEVGFGLARSRLFLRLHGGMLSLRNPGREGSVFEVRLPACAPRYVLVDGAPRDCIEVAGRVADVAARELRVEAALGKRPPLQEGRPVVLVIGRSRSVQRTLVSGLHPRYAAVCAQTPRAGIELRLEPAPALIVVDAELGGAQGRSLLETIKAEPALAHVPILALVTSRGPDVVGRFLDTGASDVLHKPFSLPELVARVDRMMRESQSRLLLCKTIGQHETDLLALAEEVSSRQESLESALREADHSRRYAERASRIKSNFLRMMSHELKTPITAMALQLRVFEHELGVDDAHTAHEGMARMSRSLRRLTALVDTALEWARLESGRASIRRELVDLATTVRVVAEELRPFGARKGVTVNASIDHVAALYTDARLLRLVLFNLGSRAIHVTECGSVDLLARVIGERAVVTVADGGPVLARREAAHNFEPSWAIGANDSTQPGAGFGLHVVHDFVRALGGCLSVGDANARNELALDLPLGDAEQSLAEPECVGL